MRIDPAVDDVDGGLGLVVVAEVSCPPSTAARQCQSSRLPRLSQLSGEGRLF
jgi:hypothetical protein